MIGNLKINIEPLEEEVYYLTENPMNKNEYNLICYIPDVSSINKITNNNKKLKDSITEQYIMSSDNLENSPQLIELFKSYLNNNFDLINNCNTITISHNNNQIIELIKNNPILSNKKIIIEETYNINDFEYIKETYKDMNNVYFYIKGNQEPISIDDYEKTFNIINAIVSKIKKYNFSPLEQIMYAYDLIRDRIYKEESINESPNISRDLTKVLLGDKIVCVGYSTIFETVLSQLGIKTTTFHLMNPIKDENGHVRNICYIKDEKYNIEGIYHFDITWDSKTKDNDNSHLKSYRFFAKTKDEIDLYTKKYQDRTFKGLNEKFLSECKNILETNDFSRLTPYIMFLINEISTFIDNKELLDINLSNPIFRLREQTINDFNVYETLKDLNRYIDLINKPISTDVLLKVLYNVRKIQYYENCLKYDFDLKTFSTITYNSRWQISDDNTEYFLNATFDNVPIYAKNFLKNITEYFDEIELEKNISQIKLIKTLEKIKNKQ